MSGRHVRVGITKAPDPAADVNSPKPVTTSPRPEPLPPTLAHCNC